MAEVLGKSSTLFGRLRDAYQNDKLTLFFLAMILILGIFFRVYQYGAEGGIETDSAGALAGSLKWYYPHDYFPGLMHTYPPFGNIVIGAGCMLSGTDFSPIIQQPQNFYPSIPFLTGNQYVQAEAYCLAPSYLASILLLIGVAILSFSLLNKYSALYATAFFALFGIIIQWGRVIYYDIILWALAVYGLLFLWRAYVSEKGSKKEIRCLAVAAAIFGLATATKYTAGIFLVFEIFLIFEKYSFRVLTDIGSIRYLSLRNMLHPAADKQDYAFFLSVRYALMSFITFAVVMLIPYGFSIKNFMAVKDTFFRFYPEMGTVSLSTSFLKFFTAFIFKVNLFDAALAIFSIYVLFKLAGKVLSKNASNAERYVLYLYLLLVVSLTISSSFDVSLGAGGGRRIILYLFGMIFLMSLAFSDAEYSLFKALRVHDEHKKRAAFFALLFVYVIYSAASLFATAPYYAQEKGPLCKLDEKECVIYPWPQFKLIAGELNSILNDNETFYTVPEEPNTYMYLRNKDAFAIWQIRDAFQKKYGRAPTIQELSEIFDYEGRHIRYVVLNPGSVQFDKQTKEVFEKYEPIKIVYINGIPAAYIYDVERMKTQ